MELEPDCYSKYTLRWFAAAVDVAGWVAVFVVTWGICMFIEWVTA
ncbi:hypothetical protein [Klebsiella pneumoniae]|nr:hypothetical protein [Klebsiella pneumoniae]